MPPRPGTSGRAKPAPPEANPFLPPESSSKIDAGWGAPEDDATEELEDAEASLVPEPAPPPPPRIRPPPPVAKVEPIAEAPTAVAAPEPAKPPSVAESGSTPESVPPFKKRSRAKVLTFVFLPVLVLVGGGFAYQAQEAARARMQAAAAQTSIQTTVEPTALTAEPPPPPTHTADPPPSASAEPKKAATGAAPAVSIDPASRGFLDTTQLPPGRKIVVDGRVVGTSPRRVAVRCGTHRIQIGDLPVESIDLPCGGEVTFTD